MSLITITQTYFLVVVIGIQVFHGYRHHALRNIPVQKWERFARLQVDAGLELILFAAFCLLSFGLPGFLLGDARLNGFEGLAGEGAEAVWTRRYKQLCHLFILHLQKERLSLRQEKGLWGSERMIGSDYRWVHYVFWLKKKKQLIRTSSN